jgi:hypothetical protein
VFNTGGIMDYSALSNLSELLGQLIRAADGLADGPIRVAAFEEIASYQSKIAALAGPALAKRERTGGARCELL